MRYSRAFIPTVKEAPKDATMPSHVLLLRGGYIRMVGAGIYELLPLGLRVMNKIATIVRHEMDRAGAQELLMPTLLPKEYFEESGRWDGFGSTLLRLKDRKGGDYHLGPTHEEIITDLVRREIRSYKQMPLNLYQVQMKFRDEPRPRAGLLRCREFLMKDAYSFDADEAGAQKSYEIMRDAYHRIFTRLGLEYRVVSADSGAMGGSTSAEFQVLAQNGEDAIVACTSCDYAANVEVAETVVADAAKDHGDVPAMEKVHTPKAKTIDEVVSFLGGGLRPDGTIKSLLYTAGDETVMACVRGDHDVNEVKLARKLGVDEVFLASDADVVKATKAKPGFAGPVGFEGRVIVDPDVTHLRGAVAGANETDQHLKNIVFGRDFEAEVAPIRQVTEGDECPKCASALKLYRGIEGGHIFILGTHYSEKMSATFLDEQGASLPVVMGCYGIGVSRLVATAVEQNHDDDGIRWPMAIAPYQVMLTPIGKGGEPFEVAEQLHDALEALGVEVLLDDRNERPGVKFKDADLLGIPLRVTLGARGLKEGQLELKARDAQDNEMIPLEGAAEAIAARVKEALA
ncbi:MAG: proline--tRNA ligase [Myxococcota bacterium]|nr:proline--tRNA ligase [Myxococcota bacterium]